MSTKPNILPPQTNFILLEVVYGLVSRDCRGMGICKMIAASPTLLSTTISPCGSSIAWAGVDEAGSFKLYLLRQTISVQQWEQRFGQGYFLLEEDFEMQEALLGQAIRIKAGRYPILEDGSYLSIGF